MHLRYDGRYCRGHCSDMRTEVAGNIAHPSLYPQACEFAGMPAVELCDGSSCRRRMFSFVREVSQAVPAATSQIHRRHVRTRLYKPQVQASFRSLPVPLKSLTKRVSFRKSKSPDSDQHQFSPKNINRQSKRKVMRITTMITTEKILWSFIKLSQLILKGNI